MSKVSPKVFNEAFARAIAESCRRTPCDQTYDNLFKARLRTDAKPADILHFCTEINNHYKSVASAIIPGTIHFPTVDDALDGGIPVTTPGAKDQNGVDTFYIIELVNHLDPDGAIIQVPVRQMDNYCMAFRVLFPHEDPLTTVWYASDKASLPGHLFPNVRPSGFDIGYRKIEAVMIYRGVLSKIYRYFLNFPANPVTSDYGIILMDTLYVMFGEGPRFWVVLKLLVDHIDSTTIGRPSALMAHLIRDWKSVSTAILKLWLADIVKAMGLIKTNRDETRFGDAMVDAVLALTAFEKDYGTLLTFRDGAGQFSLDSLAGDSLFLLKFQAEVMWKIQMRLSNFRKVFL